jgi:signal transduction histidine kinase
MLEELGLKSAVPWYLEGFSQRSGIRTVFEISSDFNRLPLDAELAVFRILQESLTNVHRHSGSPTADVRLFVREGMAVLEISDSGKGLPSGDIEHRSQDLIGSLGVGLRGMNERMQQLGGKLEVSSNVNGTTVVASIPCHAPE